MVKTKKLLNCENKKNEIEKRITFYLNYSYSFYLFDANRRGGVVVERSTRMREIWVQSPVGTDLDR